MSPRTEKFNPHARGPVMYLGSNKKTKDAHYFYDPKIYNFWQEGVSGGFMEYLQNGDRTEVLHWMI